MGRFRADDRPRRGSGREAASGLSCPPAAGVRRSDVGLVAGRVCSLSGGLLPFARPHRDVRCGAVACDRSRMHRACGCFCRGDPAGPAFSRPCGPGCGDRPAAESPRTAAGYSGSVLAAARPRSGGGGGQCHGRSGEQLRRGRAYGDRRAESLLSGLCPDLRRDRQVERGADRPDLCRGRRRQEGLRCGAAVDLVGHHQRVGRDLPAPCGVVRAGPGTRDAV